MPFHPSRTYCATLIPDGTPAEDIDALADAGKLPTLPLQATSCGHAARLAHKATGQAVLRAERVEEAV